MGPRRTLRRAATAVLGLLLAVPVVAAPAVSAASAAPVSSLGVAAQRREDVKYYRVRSSYNGEPEFLYEIAERFLGDGDRNPELFELNKGRVQPDGRVLEKPEEIEPGWILILPEDAQGEGIEVGPLPSAPATEAASAPAPAPSQAAAPAGEKSSPALLIVLIVAGVLVLAGLAIVAWLLLRRRRPAAPGAAPRVPKQRGRPVAAAPPSRIFDTAAAWTVDRALRVLVTGAGAAGRPVPAVYGVSLDETRIVLRLAAPDDSPTSPWEAVENGRVWQAPLRDLQALPAGDVGSPCPRLVTLGVAGGVRELVDLGQATGIISLQGDGAAARALIASWAEELTTSPWAEGVRVVAGDVRPHLAGGPRLTSLGGVREAITEAEGGDGDHTVALGGGPAGLPASIGVLILGSAPGGHDLERVQQLAGRADAVWVVIVLGQTRYDRWRFAIAADGRLDTGALGITVYTGGAGRLARK
ncbi:hypothetical protein [Actinoplanes sp. RD1]|uniref:hypothetical protein n=1 Tax=Actinoplanes sp. RD1 TaxID=3064538 RepID=UPI0027418D59|nr:hypothetical protein [Actinoplanes sp. RD1]